MDISGRAIAFVSRPAFVSRERARRLTLRAGAIPEQGKPRLGSFGSGSIAVHGLGGTVSRIRQGTLLAQWDRFHQRGIQQISEIGFLRAVGLMPALPSSDRLIEAADFVGMSGLDGDTVRILAIAGALEPNGERYPLGERWPLASFGSRARSRA